MEIWVSVCKQSFAELSVEKKVLNLFYVNLKELLIQYNYTLIIFLFL